MKWRHLANAKVVGCREVTKPQHKTEDRESSAISSESHFMARQRQLQHILNWRHFTSINCKCFHRNKGDSFEFCKFKLKVTFFSLVWVPKAYTKIGWFTALSFLFLIMNRLTTTGAMKCHTRIYFLNSKTVIKENSSFTTLLFLQKQCTFYCRERRLHFKLNHQRA